MLSQSPDIFEIANELPQKITSQLQLLGRFKAKAQLIGSRISLRKLAKRTTSHTDPILFALPEDGIAVVFHYGVIVFFNLNSTYEPEIINRILGYTTKTIEAGDTEFMEIAIMPEKPEGVDNDVVHIKTPTRSHIELIATVLSKSVILDYYEQRVAANFDNIEPIANNLKDRGRLGQSSKDILKLIGANLLTQHEMAGKIAVTEKPSLLWEHADLESLYANMMEDLEIIDRQNILDKKLHFLSNTAETSLDMLQHRYSQRLEWYIIILITFSLVLELYSLFIH